MKKVMFLLPRSVGHRLWEDGFLDALLEKEIDYMFREFSACPMEPAQKYAVALSRHGCDAIIYPELHSSIFLWHGARRDWFPAGAQEVGIVRFLQFLEEAGCGLLPLSMGYGPFDDSFEVTVHGNPIGFAEDVGSRIKAFRKEKGA